MSNPALITLIVVAGIAIVAVLILLAFLPVYAYHRGITRASPIPPIFNRPLEAAAPKPPDPVCPYKTCPFCNKVPKKWNLASDQSHWTCSNCENVISGPRPRINI